MILRELATIAFAPLIEGSMVKASDKTRALELLGEHYNLWKAAAGGGNRIINIHVSNIDMGTL
jgi:hypothetical protein